MAFGLMLKKHQAKSGTIKLVSASAGRNGVNDKYDYAGILIRPTVKLESEMEQPENEQLRKCAELKALRNIEALSPIPAQQSPAVAVPDQKPAYYVNVPAGNPDGAHQFLKPDEWDTHSTRCLFEPLYRAPLLPSPRITEQELRELLNSAMLHFHPSQSYELRIELWLDYQGRDMLNKLNKV